MRIMRLVVVLSAVLAVVTALSASGCGSSPAPPANPSGIIGRMVLVGGLVAGPRPLPNVQIEVRQGDKTGHVVASVESGGDGKFTVNVPPGHYTVVPISRGQQLVLPAPATVLSGKYVHVVVAFSVR
jgi:hypothetical protein